MKRLITEVNGIEDVQGLFAPGISLDEMATCLNFCMGRQIRVLAQVVLPAQFQRQSRTGSEKKSDE